MANEFHTSLTTLADTEQLGKALAKGIADVWSTGVTLYLNGDLGAGKTTLSRYIIQNLGHTGNVKSPTYTLVEPYDLPDGFVHHFDLYRLSDPEELEFMGVRDYFANNTLSIVEWPERGASHLAPADLVITLNLEQDRSVLIEGVSPTGETIVNACSLIFGK
jgi:tRNA threonylcarbamoyladenosine biosynthesis protein TsaE